MIKLDGTTNSLKRASIINMVSKYSVVLLGLIFNAILARILTPDDYGVVAIATVFTNFFVLFSDMGIGAAVIQNKDLTDTDTNRIFTFTLFLGIALNILFSALSIFLVKIYDNSIYYKIGPLLGVSLAFSAFNMVPNAVLMKSKKFLMVGIRTILTGLMGYIAAVVIALLGGGCYAIVIQSIITSFLVFVWNIISTGLKPNTKNITISIKKIWGFSSYQFGFNIVNYFSRNMDNLLAGYYFGSAQLGFYDKAYRLMRYPVDNLTNIITPSIQPILSEHQNDCKYVLERYNKLAKTLSILAIYVTVTCNFLREAKSHCCSSSRHR